MLESLVNKVAGLFPVLGLNTSIPPNQYLCVSSLNAGKRPATLLKRGSNTSFFSVNITKFLRASILKNICKPLLLWFIRRTMRSSATE